MRIHLESVGFAYAPDVVALDGVDLTIEPGERIAILGENGAGKTTLAKHLNGLLKPDSGVVEIGDWSTLEHSPAELAARVGYAFQNPDDQLFERTVRAEVAFGPKNLGLSAGEVDRRVRAVLGLVGLAARADTHPYDLQPTDRKLVALAATLALETTIIVIDEPTTGQDAAGLRVLAAVLDRLDADGRTIIVISHDIDFCSEHLERGVLMADGQVLADGPLAQVLSQTDLLARAAVEQPQMMRLAAALGLEGWPLTVENFIADYERQHRPQGGRP